jgi:phosphoenolpyruvate carboxylase
MNTSDNDTELSRSNRLLESVLTRVLKTQTQPEVTVSVEQLQKCFAGSVHDSSPSKRSHLLAIVEDLKPESISGVVRVFNHYFSLLNIA